MADTVNAKEMLAGAVADQMEEQQAIDKQSRDTQEGFNSQMKEARDEILKRFTSKTKSKEYPEAIKKIADAMMVQPLLIQPMHMFMQKLVTTIDKAIKDAVMELLNEENK